MKQTKQCLSDEQTNFLIPNSSSLLNKKTIQKNKMFGFTCTLLAKARRAIPAYGVFMMKNKKNPILQNCKTIGERGKKTAALYKKLSDAEKAKLAAEGKKLARK